MENASKAIIIAGGMLIAIVLMGLIIWGYTQLRNVQQTKSDSESSLQLAEFNKKLEAYNRTTVRGFELISLSNLIEDMNRRYSDYHYAKNDQHYEKVGGAIIEPDNYIDLEYISNNEPNEFKEAYFECFEVKYGESGRIVWMAFRPVDYKD